MKARPHRLLPLVAVASCAAPQAAREAENVVWIEATAQRPPAPPAPATERRRARPKPRDGPEPHHFWVLSQGEVAERREWLRVEHHTWEERYPNGAVMRYRLVGRIREEGRVGMIVRRVPSGDVEVYIPDLGVTSWPAMRVTPDGDWHDLGPMHLFE